VFTYQFRSLLLNTFVSIKDTIFYSDVQSLIQGKYAKIRTVTVSGSYGYDRT
jgi:hypothetical protein